MFNWFVTNRALRAEIREYRQEIEELKLEWEGWFDKFRRLYARLSRRVEREVKQGADDAVRDREPPASIAEPQLSLTERQRQINEQILSRRGKHAV